MDPLCCEVQSLLSQTMLTSECWHECHCVLTACILACVVCVCVYVCVRVCARVLVYVCDFSCIDVYIMLRNSFKLFSFRIVQN